MSATAATRELEAIRTSWTPLPIELLVAFEWAVVKLSPIYKGIGVPTGDGMPIILVPGFLGDDKYLRTLLTFLNRIGYQTFPSNIGTNAECPQILHDRLVVTLHQTSQVTGQRVCFITHSLGDIIAESVCQRFPGLVAGKISLAAPKKIIKAHPLVIAIGRFVEAKIQKRSGVSPGCYTEECGCPTVRSIVEGPPSPVPKAAIYTKLDGVVDWRCCLEPLDQGVNVEVISTHVGMAYNPLAMREIAMLLYQLRINEGRSFA